MELIHNKPESIAMLDHLLTVYPAHTVVGFPVPEQIQQYRRRLPDEVIDIWERFGFGIFLNGYLKVVDPAAYDAALREIYRTSEPDAVVVFVTAMADLIVYEGGYFVLVDCRHGSLSIVGKSAKLLLTDLADEQFLLEELHWQPYEQARARLGEPAYDECFGYVPLLALGGPEAAEHLEKVKLREHLSLIAGFAEVLF